jgi:hypothetical protein
MPSFPVSLLRDPDAFDDFCRPHLTELQTHVRQPWESWYDVECKSEILRQTFAMSFVSLAAVFFASERFNVGIHDEGRRDLAAQRS